MLEVITGRFHPTLESALVEFILTTKRDDPFAPVAVLVPSAPLLDHLRRLLVVEHGLSLLNLHLLTFHQLAMRLSEERRMCSDQTSPRLVDDLFLEQLVRHVVRAGFADAMPWRSLGSSSGTWGALWSSIRDLKDGALDPLSALRGLDEGCFDKEDGEWLRVLFSLYAAVQSAGAALNCGTADDLAQSILTDVPRSQFMASLRQVAYYGFYDLTQVQLSLFEAVTAAVPTTLFFPLEQGRRYDFARRFFERYVQPKMPRLVTTSTSGEGAEVRPPMLSIRNVVGREEELASTCRTILDLCETNGYQFGDIGVVARNVDPYRAILQEVFDRHRIPFTTTATRPLIHEPLCKCLLQLASLPSNDCSRGPVLDVIGSPFSQAAGVHAMSPQYRPELWKMIASALHINHGRDEWVRLEAASHDRLSLDGSNEDGSPFDRLDIASEVIHLCWTVVAPLLERCEVLPKRGSIGTLLEAFKRLVVSQLRRPQPDDGDPGTERLCVVWDAVDRAWLTLADLDVFGEEVEWSAFVELLTHAFERTGIPVADRNVPGVAILDAMAARGLSFKALFVLGLNEKEFPRYIREDPFIRDRHRRILQTTLGFKIDEKLSGYDEEALLFALLCQSATQRLSLSYQRADDGGRQLAPSPLVAEAAPLLMIPDVPVDSEPRRLTERVARRPTLRMWLPPSDVAQWMAMQGYDPSIVLRATGAEDRVFSRALQTLEQLEEEGASTTAHDGRTGPLPSQWSRLRDRGVAPTTLERYARCPFQYFASDVLRLEPVRLVVAEEPEPVVIGSLCHTVLRYGFEALLQLGWPTVALDAAVKARCLDEAVSRAAVVCERSHRTGPYLLWQLAKEQVRRLAAAVIEAEEETWPAQAYVPTAFEVDGSGVLPLEFDGVMGLNVHGRVDRIDRHRDSGAIRIVDYKYKVGGAMQADDRNLVQSAIRGKRFQPPLYARLEFPLFGPPQSVQLLFLAPRWTPPVERSDYPADVWSSPSGDLVRRTLDHVLQGIRDGRFYILPDTYCQACDFRVACRREHQPTWWRSHRDADARNLRVLRTVKPQES